MFENIGYYEGLAWVIIVSTILLLEITIIFYLIIAKKQMKASNRAKSDFLSNTGNKGYSIHALQDKIQDLSGLCPNSCQSFQASHRTGS